MKVTYDPAVDALYISIRDDGSPAVDNIDLEPGISADLDAEGRVLGIEILDARAKTGSDSPIGVSFELLGSEPVSSAS
jgi:uncharacterized protein YuzE